MYSTWKNLGVPWCKTASTCLFLGAPQSWPACAIFVFQLLSRWGGGYFFLLCVWGDSLLELVESTALVSDDCINTVNKHYLMSRHTSQEALNSAGIKGEATRSFCSIERSSESSCRVSVLDKLEASSHGCTNRIVWLWLFCLRDHFDLPARPPIWSQHRVHLFLPAAFGYQGNRPTWLQMSCVSRAGLSVSHCRCP